MPVYAAGTAVKPADIAKQGLQEAKKKNVDVVIMDTAGRLQVRLLSRRNLRIWYQCLTFFITN